MASQCSDIPLPNFALQKCCTPEYLQHPNLEDIPNHLAMPINYRRVDLTRFGIGCEGTLTRNCENAAQSNTNLLQRAIHETYGQFPSFLSGHPFILAFTSFVEKANDDVTDGDGKDCVCMIRAFCDDDNDADVSTSYTYAVPLSLDTVNTAIQWLRGNNTIMPLEEATSVEEGLLAYLKLLQEMIPLQNPNRDLKGALKDAKDFFNSHDWGPSNQ